MKEAEKHEYFMREALREGEKALALGEFPVGAVMVVEGRVLVRAHRQASQLAERNELDHAEMNALRFFLQQFPLEDRDQVYLYSTLEPCLMCYSALLLSGLRHFIWSYEDVMGGGMSLPLSQLQPLYAAMQVESLGGVLRRESLSLFQRFFKKYDYWQGSLLAEYTLAQHDTRSGVCARDHK